MHDDQCSHVINKELINITMLDVVRQKVSSVITDDHVSDDYFFSRIECLGLTK